MVAVDATLQVLNGTTLEELEVATDATSPTARALPVLDATARSLLQQLLAENGATEATLEAVRLLLAGTLAVSGPLTDTQLRATPVPVSFPADEAGLTNAELRATPVPVDGTVALNAASLAALETIGLDAATLSALETISVANFPATQAVSATDLDVRDLALTSDSVRQTLRPMQVHHASVVAGGSSTITVGPMERIRVLRIDGGCKPSTGDGIYPTYTITLDIGAGAQTVRGKELQAGEPIGCTVCLEGVLGSDLVIAVTGSGGTVEFDIYYELFA